MTEMVRVGAHQGCTERPGVPGNHLINRTEGFAQGLELPPSTSGDPLYQGQI
jgi:hypothetical protein